MKHPNVCDAVWSLRQLYVQCREYCKKKLRFFQGVDEFAKESCDNVNYHLLRPILGNVRALFVIISDITPWECSLSAGLELLDCHHWWPSRSSQALGDSVQEVGHRLAGKVSQLLNTFHQSVQLQTRYPGDFDPLLSEKAAFACSGLRAVMIWRCSSVPSQTRVHL